MLNPLICTTLVGYARKSQLAWYHSPHPAVETALHKMCTYICGISCKKSNVGQLQIDWMTLMWSVSPQLYIYTCKIRMITLVYWCWNLDLRATHIIVLMFNEYYIIHVHVVSTCTTKTLSTQSSWHSTYISPITVMYTCELAIVFQINKTNLGLYLYTNIHTRMTPTPTGPYGDLI